MKPLGGIFSVGVEEQYRWKDSVQSEAEIRVWVAEGTANGMRPWFTKFSGVLYDRRWLDTVDQIYQDLYRNERYLRNTAPMARVGMVFSEQEPTYGTRLGSRKAATMHQACTMRFWKTVFLLKWSMPVCSIQNT